MYIVQDVLTIDISSGDINLRTEAAVVTNVVSKQATNYAMKPPTIPHRSKLRSYYSYHENGTRHGVNVNYKVVAHPRFSLILCIRLKNSVMRSTEIYIAYIQPPP